MAEIDLGKVVGDRGAPGEKGDTGATPDITFTVSTGEAGTDVKVSQSGTAENPVVNLTIPRGAPGVGSVASVNGIYPDSNGNVDLGEIGGGGISQETDPTVPAWAKASTKPTYTQSEIGLGNVDNVKQYSESNPPPYPVTSVNGKTGAVVIETGGSSTPKEYVVTPNSAFINAGNITSESVNGILKVGGYFQSKYATPTDGSTPTTICWIEDVYVMGNTYAVAIDHNVKPAKAYNLLLLTEGSGSNKRTRVQFDPAGTAFPASGWMNFSIFSIIEE